MTHGSWFKYQHRVDGVVKWARTHLQPDFLFLNRNTRQLAVVEVKVTLNDLDGAIEQLANYGNCMACMLPQAEVRMVLLFPERHVERIPRRARHRPNTCLLYTSPSPRD